MNQLNNNKLKIGFIDFTLPYLLKDIDYPVGGWAVELLSWLNGLNHGVKPTVLTFEGAKQYASGSEYADNLYETYDVTKGTKYIKYVSYFMPRMIAAIRSSKVDVMIQACAGLNTGITALAAKIARKPFVYRVANDIDVDDRCKQRLRRYEYLFYQLGLVLADGFLCQNDYQLNSLKRAFPKKPARKIHNPYMKLSEPDKFESDASYVAWLGVFSAQKNLPLLFQLAEQLPHINFKVAGGPAKRIDEETRKSVEKLKQLHNVEMLGYLARSDVPTFLASAKVLLNTSHYEGFSNTYLESLAMGTPIITSCGVDPDSIIEKNQLGYVVDSIDNYSAAIDDIINMPAEASSRMLARCKVYMTDNHDPEKKANELTLALNEILQ